MNAYKIKWLFALISTICLVLQVRFILVKKEVPILNFSVLNILFALFFISDLYKGAESFSGIISILTLTFIDIGIGLKMLNLSVIVNLIAFILYLILKNIYKYKLSEYRIIEDKLTENNLKQKVQANLSNKEKGYNLFYLGTWIIIFSMFCLLQELPV